MYAILLLVLPVLIFSKQKSIQCIRKIVCFEACFLLLFLFCFYFREVILFIFYLLLCFFFTVLCFLIGILICRFVQSS